MVYIKKHILLFSPLLCFLINPSELAAQQWQWVINAGGNHQYSDADRDIAADHNGIQFIAGYFTQTLTLGTFTLVNPDDYYSDMYLAKVDSSGTVTWAKTIELGSTYNEGM